MTKRSALIVLVVALALASCGGGPPEGKVIFLGIDGLDPLAIDLLMSEGKLPNFARLRQDGAYGRLTSQKPLLSPIIWTTVATGKTPGQHGIGHFVAMDPATGEKLPVTSNLRQVKALWNITAAAGRRPAVVGWWATWPPETLNGIVVSDHTAYHFLFAEGFTGATTEEQTTHPPELAAKIAPLLQRPTDLSQDEIARFVDVSAEEFSRPFDLSDDLGHFKWALATAKSYRDVGLELWKREEPDLTMVYIEGVDSTSHLFGHLFRVGGLAGDLADQQAKFGRAVEEMYRFADELVGGYLEAMDDDTTLIVASDHGFRLGELHDDPSRVRDMRRVSERFHRLEGILYLYGRGVKRHSRLDKPVLVDLAPTVLALLGLPAAEDMPGRVLSEALEIPVVPDRIATYETGEHREQTGVARDAEVDQAVVERLEALGYLGATQSAESERNLAAIAFEEGRYDDALEIYRRLIEAEPEEPALRTSLAGALGATGDYDGALEQLEAALALDPLNVEAYHNRAVIHERQGNPALAIADYNTVLRYAPDYEPSRAALLRMTGSASANTPSSDAEQQASFLAEKASQAARRGDYETALTLLDHAETIAPQYSLVFQYRSNVAYLMGDRDAAIAALERALEFEPDNALFRANLTRLQADSTERR